MFQQNRISSILVMLTMLFVVGTRSTKADDNLPRFIIPAIDIDDGTVGGTAYITEKNPYFTVYVTSACRSGSWGAEPIEIFERITACSESASTSWITLKGTILLTSQPTAISMFVVTTTQSISPCVLVLPS